MELINKKLLKILFYGLKGVKDYEKIWKYGVLLALPLVLAGCGNKPAEGVIKIKKLLQLSGLLMES